jgi:hypothetical protein
MISNLEDRHSGFTPCELLERDRESGYTTFLFTIYIP